MAVIVKIRAIWSGFQGAPGYTNWYGLSDGDASAAANALGPRMRTFFDAIKSALPSECSVKVQRAYQVLNSVNGHITSEGSLTADPLTVTGTQAGIYSAGMGTCVTWLTGLFNSEGHSIKGRTYLVPISGAGFTTQGQLGSTFQSTISSAATAALGGLGSLGAFSRPTSDTANDGVFSTFTAASVPTKPVILRTRRD